VRWQGCEWDLRFDQYRIMRIIYCDSGFDPKEIEYMYAEEYESAKQRNIQTSLISFEEFNRGNFESALKRVLPSDEKVMGIYRGWMLKPSQYEQLYDLLQKKNIELINSPKEYRFCHYLPESYETIKEFTPQTTFKELKSEFKIENFKVQIDEFGDKPIIIKDYVKSQKHFWDEACFIPNASEYEKVNSVIKRFIELQGADLNEGLVFREYLQLEEIGHHSASGMPLTKEFRVFVKDGNIMTIYQYWDEGNYHNVKPVMEHFEKILPKIRSKFFTMDIAKKKMEIG
jgi:hypothetical protein